MDNLIFDRVQTDVNRAIELNDKYNKGTISQSELEEWNGFLKGAYGYNDLNRVNEWIEYLSELLNSYGYLNNVIVKTDWVESDFMTQAQSNNYINSINELRNKFYTLSSTPATPTTVNRLTYQQANDIEKILDDIDYLIKSMQNRFVYCGVCNCGQNRVWQQRFRQIDHAPRKTWNDLTQIYWNEFTNETWVEIG